MNDIGVKFKFKMGQGYSQHSQRLIYTASKRRDGRWQIDWEGGGHGTDYGNSSVISNIEHGDWVVVEVIRPSQVERLQALAACGVTITFRPCGTVVIDNGQWQFRSSEPEYIESTLKRAEALVGIS